MGTAHCDPPSVPEPEAAPPAPEPVPEPEAAPPAPEPETEDVPVSRASALIEEALNAQAAAAPAPVAEPEVETA
jgi:hypothetical protein